MEPATYLFIITFLVTMDINEEAPLPEGSDKGRSTSEMKLLIQSESLQEAVKIANLRMGDLENEYETTWREFLTAPFSERVISVWSELKNVSVEKFDSIVLYHTNQDLAVRHRHTGDFMPFTPGDMNLAEKDFNHTKA